MGEMVDSRSGAHVVISLAENEGTDPHVIPAPVPPFLGKCGACGTIFRPNRSPQLLPCLHSVCKACVPQPGAAETIRECPVCKRFYTLLEVTDNPFLKECPSGSGTHTVSKCAGCEETAVSGWCVECGEALCSICVSAHQRVRVTRDHTILPQILPSGFTPTVFCPTHREEPMKLFCMTCDKLTCRDCQLTYHRNHSYKFLDEAISAQREEIESLMMRVRQQRETVKQSLLDLDGRLLDLVEVKSRMKAELQKTLVYIRYALMKRAMRLLKDVQLLCGGEAERIREKQDILRGLKERQEYVLAFMEKALETDDHFALLSCKRQIHSQLQDLLSQNALPAAAMMEVTFHCDQDSCNRIATFGKIVSKEVPFCLSNSKTVQNKSVDRPLQTHNVNDHHHPIAHISPFPFSSHPPTSTPVSSTSSHIQVTATVSHPPASSILTSSRSAYSPTNSSAASSLSSVSSPVPQPSTLSDTRLQQSAPSPPSSLSRPVKSHTLPSKLRKHKQTWSFHPYQPKCPKPAPRQIRSPEPSPPPVVVSQPPTSSLPTVPEPQSSPVTSPPLIMVLSPLGTNILDMNPEKSNGHTVQTTNSVNVPDAIQTAVLLEQQDNLLSNNPQCIPPVKAPADSPCERAPPAGCERVTEPDPHATENEPSSTVTDTDATLPVEMSDTTDAELAASEMQPLSGYAVNKDSVSSNGTAAHITARGAPADGLMTTVTAGTAPGDGGTGSHTPAIPPDWTLTPVSADHGSGSAHQEPRPAAVSTLQTQNGMTVKSCQQPNLSPTTQLSLPLGSFTPETHAPVKQHNLHPVKPEHGESEASNSVNTDSKTIPIQQELPHRATPIPVPSSICKLENGNTRLPTGFKDTLEMPSPSPTLTDSVALDKEEFWNIQQPTVLQEILVRRPTQKELVEQRDQRSSIEEVKETDDDNTDSKNACEPSGPLSRQWIPQVSMLRMPISLPPSGSPLPQFRLLPGAAEDEILLQVVEEGELSVSLDQGLDSSCPSQPLPLSQPCKVVKVCCAACRTTGALTLCVACGRGFHRDCHLPTISSTAREWQCTLCRDLSDAEDLFSDERPKRPSLSLLDQRKCEHLLLALMCKTYGTILNETVELSSHYIDITLIRGRLLQKLSPPYRTPAEFVSDMWVFLDTLLKNSEETDLVVKIQKCFQKKLGKVFGKTLHPSLLKRPEREGSGSVGDVNTERERVSETLKRMRQFIKANRGSLPKKLRQDVEAETEEESQGAA
ncbi:E3 ubiquitin-protein ligase TRIM33 [Megalops cyprinoides]|uniref:E3 ubiquitin-protein ligase TRIM33 n=1 Tax=Megalops cyprinoides TaxID=118141 RepID=UPI001864F298|nr:E3 ubiquitin-protein ligase TRIM33 [Megalops cyprinoides]